MLIATVRGIVGTAAPWAATWRTAVRPERRELSLPPDV